MKQKFLLVLTFLLGLGCYAQPASALSPEDISMSIYPATQNIELNPSQEYNGSVMVANTGEQPYDVRISASPYQVDSETYDIDLSTENVYTRLYNWISFPQDTYHIEPGQSVKVEFHVSVPEDAVGGGQYAAILARSEDGLNGNSAIQVIPQVAGLIYGRVNGAEMNPDGEIVEQSIPSFIIDGNLEISETIYNTGNVDFKVYHGITVTDLFSGEELLNPTTKDDDGNNLGSTNTIVLPGTSRQNTIVWENSPRLGVYRVKQTVIFLEEEVNTEQIVIFIPSWLIWSVLGLIALLVLWIILAVRHHHHKQPQVF